MKDDNGHNVDLRDYIERILIERDKTSEAMNTSHREALALATKVLENRLEHLNELRELVVADRGQYLRMEVYDTRATLLQEQIRSIEKRLAWIMGVGSVLVLLAGAIGTVLGFIFHR